MLNDEDTPVKDDMQLEQSPLRKSRRAKREVNYCYKSIGNFQHGYYNAMGKEKANIGRWTVDEHVQFLQGLKKHGKNWKLVERHVPSRTGPQIRSHAQKFFKRIQVSCMNEDQNYKNSSHSESFSESPLDLLERNNFSIETIMAGLEKKDIKGDIENQLKDRLSQEMPPCDCDEFSIK